MANNNLKDFSTKFNELNSDNQRYIIAIQQALMFAQNNEQKSQNKNNETVA